MYAVSDQYKAAMKQPVQEFRLRGTIGGVEFTEANVLSGSFSITNQCSDGTNIQIGQVYIGELDATFINVPLDRYAWKGKQVIPSVGLKLADGTYEYVPLGIYTIDSAKHTASGVVVKCYDNMQLFDRNAAITETDGTLYGMLKIACDECGVELGQSEDEVASLTNGAITMSCYTENDIETWRDYLSWLAQAAGCNALIGRDGKLILKPYDHTVVDTIDTQHRFTGAEFSDYATRYTGISVTEAESKETKYYGEDDDNALTYNLGMNPFLQYGVTETKDIMRRNVLDSLQTINFVPFKASMIGSPAYDLMDVLCFQGGLADGDALSVITKFTYTYNGSYSVEGVGQDPSLASARSKSDKNLTGLLSNTDTKTLRYAIYENADKVVVKDGQDKQILKMRFGTTETTTAIFEGEVLVNVEASEDQDGISDAVATITYFLDDVEIETRHPVVTWQDGRYILTLHYAIQSVAAAVHRWTVNIQMAGGTVTIEPQWIQAVITGQGMAADVKWDGHIDAQDSVSTYRIGELMRILPFSDSVTVHLADVMRHGLADNVSLLRIGALMEVQSFSDSTKTVFGLFFSPTENVSLLTKTAGITDGYFTNGDVITPAAIEIQQIEVMGSGVTFTCSFDGGTTFTGWNGAEWSEDKAMSVDEVQKLTAAQLSGEQGVILKGSITSSGKLFEINLYGGRLYECRHRAPGPEDL